MRIAKTNKNKTNKNKILLVFYFQSKWANKYLFDKLIGLKEDFNFELVDITQFSIEYELSVIYEPVSEMHKEIKRNRKKFIDFADNLYDEFSRESYLVMIESYEKKSYQQIQDYVIPDSLESFNKYSSIFSLIPNDKEIFVDVGAYDGDTILKFINSESLNKNYKQIYAFEPNPKFFPLLKEKENFVPNLKTFKLGLSDRKGEISFLDNDMGSKIRENSKDPDSNENIISIQIDMLDNILKHATLIKIDTEGNECNVLKGAKNLIEKSKPNLIVDSYHYPSKDILEIYNTVMSIHKYKYVGFRISHLFIHSLFFSDLKILNA